MLSKTATIRIVVVVAMVLAALAPGASATRRRKVNDKWISRIVLDELVLASEQGKYSQLRETMQKAICERLAAGGFKDLRALTDMVYVLRACELMPLVDDYEVPEKDQGKLAKWLVEHRDVCRLLLRALGQGNNDRSETMDRFRKLLAAEPKRLAKYPDLAVAFATAQPPRHYRKRKANAGMVESFQWYLQPKLRFRFNLQKLPFEMLRYIADTRLSIAERKWIWGLYGGGNQLEQAYFHTPFDIGYMRNNRPKKVASMDYTLANLRRVGGSCIDRAYYGSEVCKAMGVPAVISSGKGLLAWRHHWVEMLVKNGRRGARWGCKLGRHKLYDHSTGKVHDAAAGGKILDMELVVNGQASQLSLSRREEADAAAYLARFVALDSPEAPKADCPELKKLAALHDARFGSKAKRPAGAKPVLFKGQPRTATVDWLAAESKLDTSMAADLLSAALKRNVVDKQTWDVIVTLRQGGQLSLSGLDRFLKVMIKSIARPYPDYSCDLVIRIAGTVKDIGKRESLYRRAMKLYSRRDDLRGKLLLALANDLRDSSKPKKALRAYGQAAMTAVDIREVVFPASKEAEKILIDNGGRKAAIEMYRTIFDRVRPEQTGPKYRRRTVRYKIGDRLVALLEDDGQTEAAAELTKKIGKVSKPSR